LAIISPNRYIKTHYSFFMREYHQIPYFHSPFTG